MILLLLATTNPVQKLNEKSFFSPRVPNTKNIDSEKIQIVRSSNDDKIHPLVICGNKNNNNNGTSIAPLSIGLSILRVYILR